MAHCHNVIRLLNAPLSLYRSVFLTPGPCSRLLSTTSIRYCDNAEAEKDAPPPNHLAMPNIDVQTSIRYMQSKSYEITYGDTPIWVPYRRNHKGLLPPESTRKKCIRGGVLATGNPCPICRDVYLVVNKHNVDLLKQFVSEYSGELISFEKTGVCQEQHKKLMVAIEQARDLGLIERPIPFRQYDYTQYYPQLKDQPQKN